MALGINLADLAPFISKELAKIQAENFVGEIEGLDPEKIEEKISQCTEELTEIYKDSLADGLDTMQGDLELLYNGSIDFVTRLASVPLAIIGMGTTGPTISINLILPLIKQLQGEARNLANVYKKVESSIKGFEIDKLAEKNETIGTIYGLLTAALSAIAILVSLVGVKCGKEKAKDTSEYEKSPMPVDAKDCDNYRADEEHPIQEFPPDPIWCTRFEHVMTKTLEDFQDDESGTAAEKYEAWRKDNAKVLEDFQDDPKLGTAEEQYLSWLRENRACKNCKNYKK
jgi:hypothetical protein